MTHHKVTQWIVITDLDGTLLNHHSYATDNALTAIRKLKMMNIPIIFNTSKTFDECKTLQEKLGINDSFIVENGSCIYIPKSQYPIIESSYESYSRDQYWGIILGKSHSDISDVLNTIDTPSSYYKLLSKCSIEEASKLTGLSLEQTKQAVLREFSEPLIWNSNEDNLKLFKKQLQDRNFNTLQGGRFLHVLGNCDKGIASITLKDITRKQKNTLETEIKTIILGDSQNDAAMLNVGDISIIVKSPSNNNLTKTVTPTIQTTLEAPDGWSQGINAAIIKAKDLQ